MSEQLKKFKLTTITQHFSLTKQSVYRMKAANLKLYVTVYVDKSLAKMSQVILYIIFREATLITPTNNKM